MSIAASAAIQAVCDRRGRDLAALEVELVNVSLRLSDANLSADAEQQRADRAERRLAEEVERLQRELAAEILFQEQRADALWKEIGVFQAFRDRVASIAGARMDEDMEDVARAVLRLRAHAPTGHGFDDGSGLRGLGAGAGV